MTTSSGGSGGYNNYWKAAQFDSNSSTVKNAQSTISQALKAKGLPSTWIKPLMELVARESGFNPSADNPSSTAEGYFQFLDKTRAKYGGKKVDWNDPYQQTLAGIQYVIDRYSTPEKALAFWDKNNWY